MEPSPRTSKPVTAAAFFGAGADGGTESVPTPGRVLGEDIEEGTVVACFGAVRELREGEDGTGTACAICVVNKFVSGVKQASFGMKLYNSVV